MKRFNKRNLDFFKESRRNFYEDTYEDDDYDDIDYSDDDVEISDVGDILNYDAPFAGIIGDPDDWKSQKTPEELQKRGYKLRNPVMDTWSKKGKDNRRINYFRGSDEGTLAIWQRDVDDEMNGDDGIFDIRNTGIDLDDDNSPKLYNLKYANPIDNRARIKKWEDDWNDSYEDDQDSSVDIRENTRRHYPKNFTKRRRNF